MVAVGPGGGGGTVLVGAGGSVAVAAGALVAVDAATTAVGDEAAVVTAVEVGALVTAAFLSDGPTIRPRAMSPPKRPPTTSPPFCSRFLADHHALIEVLLAGS